MADPTQLSIYNGALRLLGQKKLANTSEGRAARENLDEVWDANGLKACLEMGFWNFAMRSVQIVENESEEPEFGFTYAFDKPTDWVRTFRISSDEYFSNPLLNFSDEGENIYADATPIYLQYVSDDANYGLDFALWPESFRKFVHAYFANEIASTILKNKKSIEEIEEKFDRLRRRAKSTDAMNEATRFPAAGPFVRSRRGGLRERGNRGSLIG